MRSFLKKTAEALINTVFPQKCIGCKADIGFSADYLCNDCRRSFKNELDAGCLSCGKPYSECRCKPSYLTGITLLTTMPYKSENSVSRSLIIQCKRRKNRAVLNELAENMARSLKENGIGDEFAVTYVPRSPKAMRKSGFDQAKELAWLVSKKASLHFSHTLICRETDREQKTLALKMRQDNAHQRFYIPKSRAASIQSSSFILVDDVVTSGATLTRCAELLYESGAQEVICLCAARTVSFDQR